MDPKSEKSLKSDVLHIYKKNTATLRGQIDVNAAFRVPGQEEEQQVVEVPHVLDTSNMWLSAAHLDSLWLIFNTPFLLASTMAHLISQ